MTVDVTTGRFIQSTTIFRIKPGLIALLLPRHRRRHCMIRSFAGIDTVGL